MTFEKPYLINNSTTKPTKPYVMFGSSGKEEHEKQKNKMGQENKIFKFLDGVERQRDKTKMGLD